MKKRLIALFTAAAVACTSTTAYAHDEDILLGDYRGRNSAEFVLRIEPSARNKVLTYSDVYQYGTAWNGISSNVKLSVVTVGGGTPTILNQLSVYGTDLGFSKKLNPDGTYDVEFDGGNTMFYDENANQVNSNLNCVYSVIIMNTNDNAMEYYKLPSVLKDTPKKVFLHEIGHALKLDHPWQNSTKSGHSYDGFPKAIMNYGFPNGSYISSTITEHDKACLKRKWGL